MNMTKTIDFLAELFPPGDQRRTADLPEQRRILQEETEANRQLGNALMQIVESHAEQREIDKFKLHLTEIETITSVLLKLSSRWSKIENALRKSSDQNKASLLEQREKIRKKHDEAKYLKEGIDRRTRALCLLFRKYFTAEQSDDLERFLRLKSRLMLETKDIEDEEELLLLLRV